ncbi:MAG: hypothetical protein KBH06_05325 [Spirochaetes bacterium]|nr:hypothetical protein [Spirochaetota bacterium]MBP9022606.1 hypothetical protein [Spirochaetota bacterium]
MSKLSGVILKFALFMEVIFFVVCGCSQGNSAPASSEELTANHVEGNGRYQVNGRFLFDPWGENVVIRGIENPLWNDSVDDCMVIIDEVEKTGANTFRILPLFPPEPAPYEEFKPYTVNQIETAIKKVIAAKMIPDVAVAGGKFPDVYLQEDMKTMLLKYQDRILIHAMGEADYDDTELWVKNAKAVIAKLRNAGYTCPLYIMADWCGRKLPTLLERGQEVLNSDPLKNIIFGWQAYWGEEGQYYQNMWGMTMKEALDKVRQAPIMIQIGLIVLSDTYDSNIQEAPIVDYSLIMAESEKYDMSWLFWSWCIGAEGMKLSLTGFYGDWDRLAKRDDNGNIVPGGLDLAVGEIIVLSDPNSLSKTSRKNSFLEFAAGTVTLP